MSENKTNTHENNVNKNVEAVVTKVTPTNKVVESDKLLKIAVIGCGNCGSMLASDACEQLGIDAIAINGAERDLRLISPNVIPFVTGDGKGTGKDRNKAKEFFLEDSGLALDSKFNKTIEDNDVIIVATSCGGGYGSGSSTELIELLNTLHPEKIVVAAGVLPFSDEQYVAFEGTKKWLKELNNLGVGYMLYDNNRFPDLTPNKAAKKINEAFVNDIKVLQGDFIDRTFTGGIDERDMLSILSTDGRMVIDSITGLEPANVINNSIITTIKNHINNESAHADLVSDKIIYGSALMYSLGDDFDEFKNTIRTDLKSEFGTHVKDPSNFSDEDKGTVALVLTGLSAPNMVIDRIFNRAKELGNDINNKKSTESKLFREGVSEDVEVKVNDTKQSFADEISVVKAKSQNKEELLKAFLEKKKVK